MSAVVITVVVIGTVISLVAWWESFRAAARAEASEAMAKFHANCAFADKEAVKKMVLRVSRINPETSFN